MSHSSKRLYPPDVLPLLKKVWKEFEDEYAEPRPALPPDSALVELLSVCYHTSLLKEEGRKLKSRLIVLGRGMKPDQGANVLPKDELRYALFDEPSELSIAELRRLAPAADSTRSMICVDYDKARGWQIWGLMDTGDKWHRFEHHETSSGAPPPRELTIYSPGPGELLVMSNGYSMLALRSGSVYFPKGDALWEGPISQHLEAARKRLYKETIESLGVASWDADGEDDDYPSRFYNMCLSRILNCIRDLNHGGTLLLVPDELGKHDQRLEDRASLKHSCSYEYVWRLMREHLELHRKYYDLYFPAWRAPKNVPVNRFHELEILDDKIDDNDQALADCFRFIATLSAVDGAVVMTDTFRVLGFGAEVIAHSPNLREISIAEDSTGIKTKSVSIEAYGTRHRSAFRFCSSYEAAMAFIVSSDGGVKATKRIGSRLVMWPEVG